MPRAPRRYRSICWLLKWATKLTATAKTEAKPRDVQILDDLINKFYNEIKNKDLQEVKLGDLLKMIETRRKLTPQGGDQKDFWKMIDNIRRESLEKPKPKSKRKTSAGKRTRRDQK